MGFLQNRKVCFNQKRLPIPYHNFCHKSLFRPKGKYLNLQIFQTISCKTKFSYRDNIYLVDLKYNILTKISLEKLRSDQFLYPEMLKMAKKLPYNLHGWAFYKIAKFVLTKKGYQWLTTISVTKLTRISIRKLQDQFFAERYNSPSRSHKITKLTKISGRKLWSDLFWHPKWPKITNIHLTTYMCGFIIEL